MNISQSLDRDIVRYGIIVGVIYQSYQTLASLYPVFLPQNGLINIVISILLLLLLVLIQNKKDINWIALSLHLLAFTGFTYFWINYGGMAGAVPGFLCAYITFIVMTTRSYFRGAAIFLFFGFLFVMLTMPERVGMSTYSEPQKVVPRQALTDYLIIGGIMVAFVYYFKSKFSFYQREVSKRFHQLNKSANTLHSQNQELGTSEEETRAINENLESIVQERAHQMEVINKELTEYAFINAHMLRGPLCRIIGLINLMEKESRTYDRDQINRLKEMAEQIDLKVRDINRVLN